MATYTGTYDLTGLIASQASLQSAAAFGPDNFAAILQADANALNRIVNTEFMSELVETTNDRQRISGVSTTGTMLEVDDYGRAPTQKQVTPPSLGVPLKLYQFPIGWTRKAIETRTVRDLALVQIGAQRAYLRTLLREAKKAFYLTTNYTFADRLVDGVSLSVKRLANADSFAIPDGPNGETFTASSHNHYSAENGITASGMLAGINTVVEHGVDGPVVAAISSTDETAVRALTGFTPAADPRLVLATSSNQTMDRLDLTMPNDRIIGYLGAAEVWVKPWAIASYIANYVRNSATKPLAMRQRAGMTGLRLAAELDAYPLLAEFNEAEFGFAVINRVRMSVYYFGAGSYADPTIT